MTPHELHSERLVLRQWRSADHAPFARLNADPRAMTYFPAVLSRRESDHLAQRLQSAISKRGWGFWAVAVGDEVPFIGFVGLQPVSDELPMAPAVEIGWRILPAHWGKGYATEAARVSLDFAFGTLGLDEVVSFTAVENRPSRAVMARLGMVHAGETFDHPKLPVDSPLRRHVLYRLPKSNWEGGGLMDA